MFVTDTDPPTAPGSLGRMYVFGWDGVKFLGTREHEQRADRLGWLLRKHRVFCANPYGVYEETLGITAFLVGFPGSYLVALTVWRWRSRIGTPIFVAIIIGLLGPPIVLLMMYL